MKKLKIYSVKIRMSKGNKVLENGRVISFKNKYFNGLVFHARNPREAMAVSVQEIMTDDMKADGVSVEAIEAKIVKTDFLYEINK